MRLRIFSILPYNIIYPLLEPKNDRNPHNKRRYAATHSPKIFFGAIGVDDALDIHAEVGREEREW